MYSRYDDYQPFIPLNNRLNKDKVSHNSDKNFESHEDSTYSHRGLHKNSSHSHHESEKNVKKSKKEKGGLLGNLLGGINLDSSDILILLIILFLSQESDEDELLIMLALYIFMG